MQLNNKELLKARSLFGGKPGGGSGGGTSIDVTAEVGQTIIVKEVDANGKPTKWESADHQPRTHYMETVLPETTGEASPEFGGVLLPPFTLIGDEKYNVKYNGVEYTCKCLEMEGLYALGNLMPLEFPFGNGEPFGVLIQSIDEGVLYAVVDYTGATSSTISISRFVPIQQQYLANAFPYYIDITGEGTSDNPYVCNESCSNIDAIYNSGRTITVRLAGAGGNGSTHCPLFGEFIDTEAGILNKTYVFSHFGINGGTDEVIFNQIVFHPKDDNTYTVNDKILAS